MSSVAVPSSIRGRYEILGKISEGAYSVTYLGKKDGKNYAIKVFSLENIRTLIKKDEWVIPTLSAMLEINRRIMGLLNRKPCANIRLIYDVGDVENPYVVMEYLDYNLKEYVERRGVSPRTAVKIILDVARGLKFVFDNTSCYCHGDISPDNIFISEEKGGIVAKLGDFDGARFRDLSVTPALFKLKYRPPQPEPDEKWDVYSLGLILAELVVGESGANRIRNAGSEAVDEFPGVSEGLKKALKGSTEFSMEKRFTLDEFINALEASLQPLPWEQLEKEVKDVAISYKMLLERLRIRFDSNVFNRIKYDIDPKFDELATLWEKRREESIPRMKSLVSQLRKELSSLLKELS